MSVFESRRKVQVFGSSLALTLPAMFVKANEVEKGHVVKVVYGLDRVLVVSWDDDDDPEALIEHLMSIVDRLEERIKKSKVAHARAVRINR